MNLEARIERIEARFPAPEGTAITRTLHPTKGVEWVVGFGQILSPKQFFSGKTISECLDKAEEELKIK